MDLCFRLTVKPPLPRICVLRSTKLCCAVEDENSFDRHAVAVLKDGRVVGHVHVAIFAKHSKVVSQPDSSHRPRDYMAGGRAESLASGNHLRSVKKAKTSFQTICYMLHTRLQLFYTCNTCTRARTTVPQTGSSGPRGGACNGGKIILYSNFTRK